MSSLAYIEQIMKVIVAQITQTIGWQSIQSTPLELVSDLLQKYLTEITRQTQRYSELCKLCCFVWHGYVFDLMIYFRWPH